MALIDLRKRTVYFPGDMIDEIQREADRLNKSIAEVIRQAWDIAKPEIEKQGNVLGPALRREEWYGASGSSSEYLPS